MKESPWLATECSIREENPNHMTKYNPPDLGKNAEGPVWEEVRHALTFRCGHTQGELSVLKAKRPSRGFPYGEKRTPSYPWATKTMM